MRYLNISLKDFENVESHTSKIFCFNQKLCHLLNIFGEI